MVIPPVPHPAEKRRASRRPARHFTRLPKRAPTASLGSATVRALFPGSFDPVTPGHQDVLRRAALLFDEVVACVMVNPAKTGRLPLAERLDLLRAAAAGLPGVTVDSHAGGLLVDYCRRSGIGVVVRGVRNGRDLDHELPMADLSRRLAGIETLLLPADPARAHLSSTVVTATVRPG
jgi:pantetheine-phosphate adenylyltransferase